MLPIKSTINQNVLGVDIGNGSLKIAQTGGKKVTCYGYQRFSPDAIGKNGEIANPSVVAEAMKQLIEKKDGLHGEVTTKTIAFSVPNAHTYNRILQLPKLPDDEMFSAVTQEAEQSIPQAIDELLIDFDVIQEIDGGLYEVLMMAIPREIIDSYMTLFKILNLTPVLIKSNIDATVDAIISEEDRSKSSAIVDFGSRTTDLAIFDRSIRVTGTLGSGGNQMDALISNAYGIDLEQAHILKMIHGINSNREDKNLLPLLEKYFSTLFMEIKKIIRFFEDRSASDKKIEQILAIGGGASIPGAAEYIANNIGLPVKVVSAIPNVSYEKIEAPSQDDVSLFATAFGLSIAGSTFAQKVSKS